MKKLLTILLAMLLVVSMSMSALAADDTEGEGGSTPASEEGGDAAETTGPSATHADVTVKKAYTVNGEEGTLVPNETLKFTVTPDEKNPDTSVITVADLDTSKGLNITISFPAYTKMGVYKYTVTENKGETLGVTYDESSIEVVVTVVNENAGKGGTDVLKAYVGVFKEVPGSETTATTEYKIGGDPEVTPGTHEVNFEIPAFTNDYSNGQLAVSKTVTGNLASNTKLFDITVSFAGGAKAGNNPITFTLPDGTTGELSFAEDGTVSKDISLKHGDTATFTNIPAGVTYTVVEAEKHTTGELNGEEGYTATYTNSDNATTDSGSGSIEAADEDTVAIQNEKKTEIETGIFLDSLPYVLVIGVVAAAVVLMNIRKRREMEG